MVYSKLCLRQFCLDLMSYFEIMKKIYIYYYFIENSNILMYIIANRDYCVEIITNQPTMCLATKNIFRFSVIGIQIPKPHHQLTQTSKFPYFIKAQQIL